MYTWMSAINAMTIEERSSIRVRRVGKMVTSDQIYHFPQVAVPTDRGDADTVRCHSRRVVSSSLDDTKRVLDFERNLSVGVSNSYFHLVSAKWILGFDVNGQISTT